MTKGTWDDLYERVRGKPETLKVCNLVMKHLWEKRVSAKEALPLDFAQITITQWGKMMPNWWLPADWKTATWIEDIANQVEKDAKEQNLMNGSWHRNLQWFTKLVSNKYVPHSTNDIVNLLAFASEPNPNRPTFGNRSGDAQRDINTAKLRFEPVIDEVQKMLMFITVDKSNNLVYNGRYQGMRLRHADTIYMDKELDDWYAKIINDVIACINGVRAPTMVGVTMTHEFSTNELVVPAIVDDELLSMDQKGHWNERKINVKVPSYTSPAPSLNEWHITAKTIHVKKLLGVIIEAILHGNVIHLHDMSCETLIKAHGIRQMFSLANMLDDNGDLIGIQNGTDTHSQMGTNVTNERVEMDELFNQIEANVNMLDDNKKQSVHAFLFCLITLSNDLKYETWQKSHQVWYTRCLQFLPRFLGVSLSSGIRSLIDVQFTDDVPEHICRLITYEEDTDLVFVRVPCKFSTCKKHDGLIDHIRRVLVLHRLNPKGASLFIAFLWKEDNGLRPYVYSHMDQLHVMKEQTKFFPDVTAAKRELTLRENIS